MSSPTPEQAPDVTDGTTAPAGPIERVDPETGQRYDQQGRRLCSANRSNGNGPCRAPAITGMKVCRTHGGAAPQVKRKAALRLMELVDPAIATLAREMVQADSSSDRQRAANSILDRAGVPRVTKEIAADDSRAVLLTRLREIRQQKADGSLSIERTAEQVRYPSPSPDSPGALTPTPEEAP